MLGITVYAFACKVAKSHCLTARLTDIHLFSHSHDASYFSQGFLPGSHYCVVV